MFVFHHDCMHVPLLVVRQKYSRYKHHAVLRAFTFSIFKSVSHIWRPRIERSFLLILYKTWLHESMISTFTICTFSEWYPWWFTYAFSCILGAIIAMWVQSIAPMAPSNECRAFWNFNLAWCLASGVIGNCIHCLNIKLLIASVTLCTLLLIDDWLMDMLHCSPTGRWKQPVAS